MDAEETNELFSNLAFVVNKLLSTSASEGGGKTKTKQKKRSTKRHRKRNHRTYTRKQRGGNQTSMLIFVLVLIITVTVQALCAEATGNKQNITEISNQLRAARLNESALSTVNTNVLSSAFPFLRQKPALLQFQVNGNVYNLYLREAINKTMNFTQTLDFLASKPIQIDLKNSVLYFGNITSGEMVLTMAPHGLEVYTKSKEVAQSMSLIDAFITKRSILLQYNETNPTELRPRDIRTKKFPHEALDLIDFIIRQMAKVQEQSHAKFQARVYFTILCLLPLTSILFMYLDVLKYIAPKNTLETLYNTVKEGSKGVINTIREGSREASNTVRDVVTTNLNQMFDVPERTPYTSKNVLERTEVALQDTYVPQGVGQTMANFRNSAKKP
jgi:hypothetical protein